MTFKGILTKCILPLLVVGIGVLVMRTMSMNRPAAEKKQRINPGILVQVSPARSDSRQILVSATGTVQPVQEVEITPQVSGKVVEVHPQLVAGGYIKKQEVLFRIEDADYRLAVDKAQTSITQAHSEITILESKARVALAEWQRLYPSAQEKPNPLVVYEPQLETARAVLAAARTSLEQAKLNVARTEVSAPFDALVRSEQLAVGQYIKAGSSIARLAATEAAEIVVPLPLEEMEWVAVPRHDRPVKGSLALVRKTSGSIHQEWQGRVVRSLGEIDARSRMARLVISVDDPYRLRQQDTGAGIDLSMGMFVDVIISGKQLDNIVSLPRIALRHKNTVWIMDDNDQLRIRSVSPLRFERDEVLLSHGLAGGERIILTHLTAAAEGMKLRIQAGRE